MTEEKEFVLTTTGNFTITKGTLTTSVAEPKAAFDSDSWWAGFTAGMESKIVYITGIVAVAFVFGLGLGLAL